MDRSQQKSEPESVTHWYPVVTGLVAACVPEGMRHMGLPMPLELKLIVAVSIPSLILCVEFLVLANLIMGFNDTELLIELRRLSLYRTLANHMTLSAVSCICSATCAVLCLLLWGHLGKSVMLGAWVGSGVVGLITFTTSMVCIWGISMNSVNEEERSEKRRAEAIASNSGVSTDAQEKFARDLLPMRTADTRRAAYEAANGLILAAPDDEKLLDALLDYACDIHSPYRDAVLNAIADHSNELSELRAGASKKVARLLDDRDESVAESAALVLMDGGPLATQLLDEWLKRIPAQRSERIRGLIRLVGDM